MASAQMGGWTPFHKLSPEDKVIFEHGMAKLVGVDYMPLDVATQVVSGHNYAFFCNAKTVTREPKEYPAMVNMHSDLHGQVSITAIQELPY